MSKQGSTSDPAARIFKSAFTNCLRQTGSTSRTSRSNNESRLSDLQKKLVLGKNNALPFQSAAQSLASISNVDTMELCNAQDFSAHQLKRRLKLDKSVINYHLSAGNDCCSTKLASKSSVSDILDDSQESKVPRTNNQGRRITFMSGKGSDIHQLQDSGTSKVPRTNDRGRRITFMSGKGSDIHQPQDSGTLVKQSHPDKTTYTVIQSGNFTAQSLVGNSNVNTVEQYNRQDSSMRHPTQRNKSLASVISNHLSAGSDCSGRKPALKRAASDCLGDNFESEGSWTSNQHRRTVFMSETGNGTALLTLKSKNRFSTLQSAVDSTSSRRDQELVQPQPKKMSRGCLLPSDSSGNSKSTVVLRSTKCGSCTTVSKFSCNNSDKPDHQQLTYSVDSKRSVADITPFAPVTKCSEYSPVRRPKRARTGALIPSYDLKDVSWNPPISIIDSHCHLDFLFTRENYYNSYASYRSKHSDSFPDCYEGCITIFCEPQSFFRKHEWDSLLQEDGVWAGFGCHPHLAKYYDDEAEDALIRALDDPKVIALGEIGLDYSKRNNCDRRLQKKVLRRQLRIALDRNKPLIIHCREAHDDCLETLKEMVPRNHPIHLHCFTDTWQRATQWLTEFPNLRIGITNVVTFPSAKNVHEVARNIPIDRLLFETDTPYFVPRSLSQRWSHPGLVIHVAEKIAAFREDIQFEDLLRTVRINTYKVYGI